MSSEKTACHRIDIFMGGSPLFESKIGEGLLEFSTYNNTCRFTMRSPDFQYSKKWLQKQNIAGVLLLVNDRSNCEVLQQCNIPYVYILPGREVSCYSVDIDDRLIGHMGADFFLRKGFLRCSFCGIESPWSNLREEGFSARIKHANRQYSAVKIPFAQDSEWGVTEDTDKILRNWLIELTSGTAIMAAHDVIANRIVDLCVNNNIRVPNDIAVLGVGNHPLLNRLSPVLISSIETAIPNIAMHAASMLYDLIQGNPIQKTLCLAPKMVVERHSTEIMVFGDDMVAEIIAYISQHATEQLKVSDILKVFPISQRTLMRRFQKYVGHSPNKEIRRAKLQHAVGKVCETKILLTEIAAMCGYSDLSHMDREFLLTYGKPPKDFRSSQTAYKY